MPKVPVMRKISNPMVWPVVLGLVLAGCDVSSGGGEADASTDASPSQSDGRVDPVCGDTRCDEAETCASCPADCDECVCGNGVCDPGESGCNCATDCPCTGDCDYSTPVDDSRPLILYYGYFKDTPAAELNAGSCTGEINLAQNNRLFAELEGSPGITDTMDIVFGGSGAGKFTRSMGDHTTCTPPSAPMSEFRGLGARTVHGISEGRLRCCLLGGTASGYATHCTNGGEECDASTGYGVAATAAVLEGYLRNGFDYIQVDEIRGTHWQNNHAAGDQLLTLFDQMAQDGYNKRLLLWVEYKTTGVYKGGTDPGELQHYSNIFHKCQTHCRKLVFEVYGSDNMAYDPGGMFVTTQNVINGPAEYFLEQLATRLESISPGMNAVSMAGIGLTPEFMNAHACDLAPYNDLTCSETSSGKGYLDLVFAQMHKQDQPQAQWNGVGFYKLCGVQLCAWVSPHYSRMAFADGLRDLTSWWH